MNDSTTNKPAAAQPPGSLTEVLVDSWREQRSMGVGRGFWRGQRQMVFSDRQKEFLADTAAQAGRIFARRVAPTRVESFAEAVARLGLSNADLAVQLRRHKAVHLSLYALAGVLLVYALYLGLNHGAWFGVGALIASAGMAVSGYLHGFRAWQIENRNLIRLQDALRAPQTYLVL